MQYQTYAQEIESTYSDEDRKSYDPKRSVCRSQTTVDSPKRNLSSIDTE